MKHEIHVEVIKKVTGIDLFLTADELRFIYAIMAQADSETRDRALQFHKRIPRDFSGHSLFGELKKAVEELDLNA